MHELSVRALRYAKRRYPRVYGGARWARHALRGVAQVVQRRLGRLVFERGRQDTSRFGVKEGLEEEYNRYEPSQWTFLPRALRGERVGPDAVFVDVGCGKGRVVLQAARRPFGRVIGVEISPDKIATARHNLRQSASALKCRKIELVTMDVLEYEIPADATHIYLYNPLVGDALRRVRDNIVASYDRRPRRLRVIYANPIDEAVFECSDRFVRTRVSRGLRHDHRIAIYEVTAARGGTAAARATARA